MGAGRRVAEDGEIRKGDVAIALASSLTFYVSLCSRLWHMNVRPSNTEPLLRLNLEARSGELMERKRDEVLAVIRA